MNALLVGVANWVYLIPDQTQRFEDFLLVIFHSDFSMHYGSYKRAVNLLATTDCLLSLAKVAKMSGYTR